MSKQPKWLKDFPKNCKVVSLETLDRMTIHCPNQLRNASVEVFESMGYTSIKTMPLTIGFGRVSTTTTVVIAEKEHDFSDEGR